jgi:hypothetical protein
MELLMHLADAEQVETYWFGSRILEQLAILVIGALLGVVIQLIVDYFRRDEVEDFEVWTDVQSTSQKAEGIGRLNTGLSIHAGDREVEDPYVVDFYVWGVGKKDIRPEQFAGQSLEFKLNVPIVSELKGSTEGNIESALFSWSDDGVVRLAPSLVRARVAKRYRFLTDGEPDLEWTNPVADLRVYDLDEQWEQPSRDRVFAKWSARILVSLIIIALLGALVFSIVRSVIEGPQPSTASSGDMGVMGLTDEDLAKLPWWVFLTPVWFSLIVGLFFYGAAPSRRLKRATRLRRENLAPSGAPALAEPKDSFIGL